MALKNVIDALALNIITLNLEANTMINILEPFVYYFIVPLMYLLIVGTAVVLVVKAKTREMRARTILGAFGGLLFALVFIILDITTTGIASLTVDPRNFYAVVPFALIGGIFGFFLLFIIDLLLQKGAVAFVVLFLISASAVSAYFLITASEMRSIISVVTIMFVFGNVVYVLMNFRMISRALGTSDKEEVPEATSRWKI